MSSAQVEIARLLDRLALAAPAERAALHEQVKSHGAAAIPPLLDFLRTADRNSGKEVVDTLAALASLDPAALLPALEERESVLRTGAASALGRLGDGARPVLGRVAALLKHELPTARAAAAYVLREVSPASVDYMVQLIDALDDTAPAVRQRAAGALVRMGPAAEPAIPKLLAGLSGDEDDVLWAYKEALCAIGPGAVPPLREALRSDNPTLARHATEVLGRLGDVALPAVPDITALLAHISAPLRFHCAYALVKLAPDDSAPAAVPVLIELFGDEDHYLAFDVATLLTGLGTQAVPYLARALDHPNKRVRNKVAFTLGMIGPEAEAAVENLIQTLLHSTSSSMRVESARALGEIRIRPERSVPALTKALEDSESRVGQTAAAALVQFGSAAESAIPSLRRFLAASDEGMRQAAADALRGLGDGAKG